MWKVCFRIQAFRKFHLYSWVLGFLLPNQLMSCWRLSNQSDQSGRQLRRGQVWPGLWGSHLPWLGPFRLYHSKSTGHHFQKWPSFLHWLNLSIQVVRWNLAAQRPRVSGLMNLFAAAVQAMKSPTTHVGGTRPSCPAEIDSCRRLESAASTFLSVITTEAVSPSAVVQHQKSWRNQWTTLARRRGAYPSSSWCAYRGCDPVFTKSAPQGVCV